MHGCKKPAERLCPKTPIMMHSHNRINLRHLSPKRSHSFVHAVNVDCIRISSHSWLLDVPSLGSGARCDESDGGPRLAFQSCHGIRIGALFTSLAVLL